MTLRVYAGPLSVEWASQCRQLSATTPLTRSAELLTCITSICATFLVATTLVSCFKGNSPQATICKCLRFIKPRSGHCKLCTGMKEANISATSRLLRSRSNG